MKQLFIHIGHQKCGSTAIQQWLHRNTTILTKLGIKYIKTGRNQGYAHHQLAKNIRDLEAKSNSIEAQLKQEIASSKANYFIISAENFIEFDCSKLVVDFRDRLDDEIQLNLVIIFRNQIDWLPSQWGQLAKLGTTFDDYDTWFERWFKLLPLKYDRIYQFWLQFFQPVTIQVLSFEDLLSFSCGIVEGFFKRLNLPQPQPQLFKIEKINSAPSYQTILLSQKFFNRLKNDPNTAFLFEPGHRAEREAIYQQINQFAQKELNNTQTTWMSYQQKLQVYQYYQESNINLMALLPHSKQYSKHFNLPPMPTSEQNNNFITSHPKISTSMMVKLQEYMQDKLL